MKKLFTAFTVIAAAAAATAPPADAADLREHRSIYITPYLSDWPTSAIRSSNAETHKRNMRRALDEFKAQNVNVLYYHVRSNCDATYRSAYEPWSPGVGGTRGVEPAFDPLEFLLEECHSRGIELYAWVNPYRYCGVYSHGESPLDYELTHPEWLIVQQAKETILNPALEEVKQRICDIISDILSKYDVDGIIFDDYFYSNPTPFELDADLYNAAKKADPSVGTQIEWRVNNVNDLIGRVYNLIKQTKPYCVFGISPAGVASPPNVTSEYGLEPAPDSDWQYAAIASDPLNWYKTGHVDFMAPQIYWPSKFDALQEWWAVASRKFRRHLYSAITLSDFKTYKGAEYIREVEFARDLLPTNENGVGFFRYSTYRQSTEKIDGVSTSFDDYIGSTAYATPALTPIRPWNNEYAPAMVSNLHRDGSTLRWDAVDGMRYTIYAFAPGETMQAFSTNLKKVSYVNSYEIPDDLTGYTFGVAVYDRYGNEYSLLTEGATVGEPKQVKLTYPDNGADAAALFDFTWEKIEGDYVLEVSETADFAELLTQLPTRETSISSFSVPELKDGQTYYWRVRSHGVNSPAAVSETRSFKAGRIAVTGPTGNENPAAPVITWLPAFGDAEYFVEIGRNKNFTIIDYTATVSEPSLAVPEGILVTGREYYVRVTATRGGRSSISDIVSFGTGDVIYDAPLFVNPATDGETLHSNQSVIVNDWKGMNSVTINISTSESFPARTSYKVSLKDGQTSTPELGNIKVASKALVDGTTYYVRACGGYFTHATGSSEQSTPYAVSKFVYSAEAGVSDIVADDARVTVSADGIVSMPVEGNDIAVYTLDGAVVARYSTVGRNHQLPEFTPGMYIIQVTGPTPATIKWIKK